MRHKQQHRKLNRNRSGRTALLRGLAVSLIRARQITTTKARAKELQPMIERLVTTAKKGQLADRRRVSSLLGNPQKDIVDALCHEIAPRYSERSGGYTRVIKLGMVSPGREEAIIEFV